MSIFFSKTNVIMTLIMLFIIRLEIKNEGVPKEDIGFMLGAILFSFVPVINIIFIIVLTPFIIPRYCANNYETFEKIINTIFFIKIKKDDKYNKSIDEVE